MPPDFNTQTQPLEGHKVFKGYNLRKGSVRRHIKRFSDVRAYFLPGISNQYVIRDAAGEKNGISGSCP